MNRIEPDGKRCKRKEQHNRHEPAGNRIGETLDRSLVSLGLTDHADDLGKESGLPDAGRPHPQDAALIDGRAGHRVAGLLLHRQGLAGHHGLVHRAAPVNNLSVHRDSLAGPHQHHVADTNLGGQHLPFPLPGHQAGTVSLKAEQLFQRFACLAPGPGLQVLTQANEGDQHGRGFEERIPMGPQQAGIGQERIEIGCRGPQGHQHIHIGTAIFQGVPGASVKGQACRKLDRRGQQQVELQHGPVGVDAHGEHDRQQGRQGEKQPIALQAERIVGRGLCALQLDRCVAGLVNHGEDIRHAEPLRIETHKTGLGRQIDDGSADGRVLQQSLFQPADAGGAMQATDAEGQLTGRPGAHHGY